MNNFDNRFIELLQKISPQWDTKFKVSLGANVILLLLLGVGLWQKDRICPPCGKEEVISVVHDTIWPKDKPVEIFAGKPILVKVSKKSAAKPTLSNLNTPPAVITVTNLVHDTVPLEMTGCDYYSTYVLDTVIAGNAHITINTEAKGEVTWQTVELANLKPEIRTTITKRKIDALKLYVGLNATYNAKEIARWGIGPSAGLAVDKVGCFGYYYDARNNAHTLQAQALIRFRK